MRKSIILLSALMFVSVAGMAQADELVSSWLSFFSRKSGVEPVTDPVYKKECGSCHFPYQPGWLPESSWRRLLDAKGLSAHFGEDAELPETARRHIQEFLVDHSADKSTYKRSKKIMASLDQGETPLRITEVTYIRRKHHNIPPDLIKGDKVKSLSFCDTCHTKAALGDYDADTVVIPGKGKWSW